MSEQSDTEHARALLEELDDDAGFSIFTMPPDGSIDGIVSYPECDASARSDLMLGALATHIRTIADNVEQDVTPAYVAQASLKMLEHIEDPDTDSWSVASK